MWTESQSLTSNVDFYAFGTKLCLHQDICSVFAMCYLFSSLFWCYFFEKRLKNPRIFFTFILSKAVKGQLAYPVKEIQLPINWRVTFREGPNQFELLLYRSDSWQPPPSVTVCFHLVLSRVLCLSFLCLSLNKVIMFCISCLSYS